METNVQFLGAGKIGARDVAAFPLVLTVKEFCHAAGMSRRTFDRRMNDPSDVLFGLVAWREGKSTIIPRQGLVDYLNARIAERTRELARIRA